jgi:rfaE bifunctional protein kinase chain/domain
MQKIDFSSSSIVVAGDVMLDRYWIGDTTRISPEAPVPVVHVQSTKDVAGGAANVAVNAANLGAKTSLLSVVGKDSDGEILKNILERNGVTCAFLRDESMRTIVKLRLIARNQQIVRADFEQRPDHELLLPLVSMFGEQTKSAKVVLFSDYGKGGLTHIRLMMEKALKTNVPVLVDPKGTDYSVYQGATVITPNRSEFAEVAGRWTNELDFERKAFCLRDQLKLSSLLVTRSEEGMSLFLGGKHIRIPTQAREVFDVSGAGDTVIATMAVAMGAGIGLEEAARLANIAAGIVVSKIGTAPITLEELRRNV